MTRKAVAQLGKLAEESIMETVLYDHWWTLIASPVVTCHIYGAFCTFGTNSCASSVCPQMEWTKEG